MSFLNTIKKINTTWVIAFVFISITWINFNLVRWHSHDVIVHDISNYYSYLPAVFYEHDLTLSFLNDSVNVAEKAKYYAPNQTPEGNHVIKMSMGMAITYLPFFALAHVYSSLFNYETSGFSEPYHFAILFSSLIYFLVGLFFLSRLLRLFFNELIVVLVLLCLTFGTNILHYLTLGAGMAHVTNFALISMFFYYSIRWHTKPTIFLSIVLGCLFGLITLIRPVNILIFLFFLFYNVSSVEELKIKFKLLFYQKWKLILLGVFAFLIFLPQLLYWKFISGHYLFNSYGEERFYFNNPHVIEGLFSFRKGWLIYSPLMILALIGIYFLRKDLKRFSLPVMVLFLVYIYVTFSWWCWWYGGSFGQRVMIDLYPLLAIPLAALFDKIKDAKSIYKNSVYTCAILFVLLNIFQTIQSKYNIIHYDSMTRRNYFKVFSTTTKQADREKYLQHPDYKKALKGEDEY